MGWTGAEIPGLLRQLSAATSDEHDAIVGFDAGRAGAEGVVIADRVHVDRWVL